MAKKIKTKVKKLGKSQIPKAVISKLKRGCWTCEEYSRRIQEERTQKQQPIINFPSEINVKIISDKGDSKGSSLSGSAPVGLKQPEIISLTSLKQNIMTQTDKPLQREAETQIPKKKKLIIEEEDVLEPVVASKPLPPLIIERSKKPNKETINAISTAYGLNEEEAISYYMGERDRGISANDIRKEVNRVIEERIKEGQISTSKEKGGIRIIKTPSRMEAFRGRTLRGDEPSAINFVPEKESESFGISSGQILYER